MDKRVNLLMIMILAGNYLGAKLLIDEFEINLETEQSILLDGTLVTRVTVLWVASAMGNLSIVKLLLSHGVDVNHSNENLSTPLRIACFSNHLDIVRYLLKHGACVESRNSKQSTCLMLAASKGFFSMVND